MTLDPKEIKLTNLWQRIAFLVFATGTSVALLPMLVWPQSGIARVFCVVAGSVGMIAMAILLGASARTMFAPNVKTETDAS